MATRMPYVFFDGAEKYQGIIAGHLLYYFIIMNNSFEI